jgi:hypothetical protein
MCCLIWSRAATDVSVRYHDKRISLTFDIQGQQALVLDLVHIFQLVLHAASRISYVDCRKVFLPRIVAESVEE